MLIIVKPETVVRCRRAGFKAYWRWRSKRRAPGRPPFHRTIRELIRRLATDNPTWGAPRVHGELLKLGMGVPERTVSRYMPRRPSNPDQVMEHDDVIEQLATTASDPPSGTWSTWFAPTSPTTTKIGRIMAWTKTRQRAGRSRRDPRRQQGSLHCHASADSITAGPARAVGPPPPS